MRNKIKLFVLLFFAFGLFACAGEADKTIVSNENSALAADIQTYQAAGVVKAIDIQTGKVTLNHGEIPGYMSAMEMNEAVSDKKLLESLAVGDEVNFELTRTGAKILITKLNKIAGTVNGNAIYKINCAVCHGETGEGEKKAIPLITGHALHHSEANYIEQIENGEGKKMTAFKNKLTAAEIQAVVKFVREDLQKEARQNKKPEAAHHNHD